MAAPRRIVDISIGEEELALLVAITRSRTEPACRVERARMLLAYQADPSTHAVGEALGVSHHTVLRCLDRAVRFGVMAALDDRPRPGKAPEITADAKAWLVSLACRKAKDLGYPHELWTTRLLAHHLREQAAAAGHPCLDRIAHGTVCKILARHDVKPHKVRYYLERRDEAFETKMAEVLCDQHEAADHQDASSQSSPSGWMDLEAEQAKMIERDRNEELAAHGECHQSGRTQLTGEQDRGHVVGRAA